MNFMSIFEPEKDVKYEIANFNRFLKPETCQVSAFISIIHKPVG
jgi:hypothetical protein